METNRWKKRPPINPRTVNTARNRCALALAKKNVRSMLV
jgi:hypothetical protein